MYKSYKRIHVHYTVPLKRKLFIILLRDAILVSRYNYNRVSRDKTLVLRNATLVSRDKTLVLRYVTLVSRDKTLIS